MSQLRPLSPDARPEDRSRACACASRRAREEASTHTSTHMSTNASIISSTHQSTDVSTRSSTLVSSGSSTLMSILISTLTSRRSASAIRMRVLRGLAACSLVVGWGQQAQAAGFAVHEQGAASAALGGAATARPDLADAQYYNAAAWAVGSRASLSVAALWPTLSNQASDGQTQTEATTSAIPSLGAGLAWRDVAGLGWGDAGLGLSLGAPFGSSVRWPQGWPGRYDSEQTSLQVLELGLSGAWRPQPWVSLGAGLRAQRLGFSTQRALDVARPEQDARVRIDGASSALAWQGALLLWPTSALTVGLSWRSGSAHLARGAARFEDVPLELESRARDSATTTRFDLPGRLALGLAYRLGGATTLSLDAERFGWGVVDALRVDFEDPALTDLTQPRGWRATWALKLGAERAFFAQRMVARAGFFIDPSPAPANTLGASSPDGDRVGGALGAGLAVGQGLRVDVSLGYTAILERQTTQELGRQGRYAGRILSGALGLAWTPATSK